MAKSATAQKQGPTPPPPVEAAGVSPFHAPSGKTTIVYQHQKEPPPTPMQQAQDKIHEYVETFGGDSALHITITTLLDDFLPGIANTSGAKAAHEMAIWPLRKLIVDELRFEDIASNLCIAREQAQAAVDICKLLETNVYAQNFAEFFRWRIEKTLQVRPLRKAA